MLHLDVVQLEHVDVIGLQTLETFFEREPHVLRVETLRELALAAARSSRALVVDVVAYLGCVDDVGPPARKCSRELTLAAPVAVAVGSVEEIDAVFVMRTPQQLDRLLVCLFTPPARCQRPRPEPDLAHAHVGAGELSELHLEISPLLERKDTMSARRFEALCSPPDRAGLEQDGSVCNRGFDTGEFQVVVIPHVDDALGHLLPRVPDHRI